MRYFLGFLASIGLIIVVIILLLSGGGKPQVQNTQRTLVSYAQTGQVRMTIDGPVNADQDHRQVRISVDKDQITFQTVSGYEGSVTSQQQFNNSLSAYQNFLQALARSGYTRGNSDKSLADERGFCPLGRRYIFELNDAGQTKQRFWGTSCNGTMTYQGSLNLTISLFKAQVPDYSRLVRDVDL